VTRSGEVESGPSVSSPSNKKRSGGDPVGWIASDASIGNLVISVEIPDNPNEGGCAETKSIHGLLEES
jgi:hypothetical protein